MTRLYHIMDLIVGTARRIDRCSGLAKPPRAPASCDFFYRATGQLAIAVNTLEKDRNGAVLEACKQVKALEEEGHSVYHEWVGRLFDENSDPMTVIKWKEIYDTLERTLDQAEDVSNVLESVSIKHA